MMAKYLAAGRLTRLHPQWGTDLLLQLALKPERRPSPRLSPEQRPDRQEWLRFEGHRVAVYRWLGRGPTIFVGHGWSSSTFRLIDLVDCLRGAGYGVLACDQLAHGRSGGSRANLPRFTRLTRRVIERNGPVAAAVGHSLGAAALAVARSEQQWTMPLALLAPPAEPRFWFQQIRDRLGLSEEAYLALLSTMEREEEMPFESLVPEVTMRGEVPPTLVVHGEADRVISVLDGQRYEMGEKTRWLVLPGVDHSRVARDPITFETLSAWLQEVL